MNTATHQFVVFRLDDRRYALHLSAVEKITLIVQITALPGAPAIVLGVVNVRGQIIPVINMRKRFGLPDEEFNLSDHLIIAHTSNTPVALVANSICGVIEHTDAMAVRGDMQGDLEYIEGALKLNDGLVLIHNLDRFLSFAEQTTLQQAMTPVQR